MNVWLIQALWVLIPISPLLIVMTNKYAEDHSQLNSVNYAGIAIWVIGMGIEVVADNQKTTFNTKP